MNVTISQELQERITGKIKRGDVASAEALVEQALNFYFDYEQGETDEEEFHETKAAIDDALEQGERGEGRPADEVFARLQSKYGIPR